MKKLPKIKEKVFYSYIKSPIDDLLIVTSADKVLSIGMDSQKDAVEIESTWQLNPDHPLIKKTKDQLDQYFNGQRKEFDLPLLFQGTKFQQQVWRALLDIPYGECISYGEQARRIKNAKAVRAVGMANGKNPIAIVIPCHRVVGANGKLTGYGGGLPRKKFLLDLEGSGNLIF